MSDLKPGFLFFFILSLTSNSLSIVASLAAFLKILSLISKDKSLSILLTKHLLLTSQFLRCKEMFNASALISSVKKRTVTFNASSGLPSEYQSVIITPPE